MNETRQPRIVVADDDPDTLECLIEVFSQKGYEVAGCPDGLAVQASIAEMQPDLVILDAWMPRMDGITLFENMRADPRMQNIPIIFFTASSEVLKQRLVVYKARGAALVVKPDVSSLIRHVQEALAQARAA
jgi:two-component system alkaline phosphatase synthesis response regulator PhoP